MIAELLLIHVTIPINASHIMLLIVDILSPSCVKTSWKFNKYIRSSEALFRFSKLQKIAIHKHKKQKKKKEKKPCPNKPKHGNKQNPRDFNTSCGSDPVSSTLHFQLNLHTNKSTAKPLTPTVPSLFISVQYHHRKPKKKKE